MTDDTVEVKTRLKKTRRLRMGKNKSQTDGSNVASIRISGLYLHDLGFSPDGFLDLEINEDKTITLHPVSAEQAKADMEAAKAVKEAAQ